MSDNTGTDDKDHTHIRVWPDAHLERKSIRLDEIIRTYDGGKWKAVNIMSVTGDKIEVTYKRQ